MNYTLVHLPIAARKSIEAGKLFLAVCSLLLLSSCGGGSDSTSLVSPQTVTSDVQSVASTPIGQSRGVAQKGPFAIESKVQLSELDIAGNPTGKTRQTKVSSKTGAFFYDSVDEWSYINIHVEGSFYDESEEETPTQPISLSAISTDSAHTSVNLLTYWIAERSKHLLLEGNLSLVEALKQSEQELNQLLGILHTNQLDITQASHLTTDNASLLLVSGALMDVARQHQLNASILIEQIAVDFAEDGRLEGLGKNWLIRMQAVIRDNPRAHTTRYARVLNKLSGVTAPTGKALPTVISLASRPAAVVPTQIAGQTGTTIILDGSASNDGQGAEPVNFTWFRVDQQAQFDVPISNRFIASPSITLPNQVAELLFALIVTDADGLIDTSVVRVIASEVFNNTPPEANSQLISTDEDTPLSILLTGSDQDGDPLNFPLATPLLLPHGLLDGIPPNLTYTPTQDFNGTDSFTYTVSDGKETSAPATVTITINPVNDRPVANAGADQNIVVGGIDEPIITLNGTGSDLDGSVVLFAWTQTGGAITIPLSNTGVANPTLVPPPNLPPLDTTLVLTYELVVTDNDGSISVADSVTITVNPAANLPPVANAGIDQIVTSGDLVTLNGTGTDPDGTVVDFVWADNGIPLSNPNSAAPTFTAPTVITTQVFTFDLLVVDDGGAVSLIDSVIITVNPAANLPPIANVVDPEPLVLPNEQVILDGSPSIDPDGTIVGFEWTSLDVTLQDPFTPTPSFTAPEIGIPILIILIVTDNEGAVSEPLEINVFVDDLGGGGGGGGAPFPP